MDVVVDADARGVKARLRDDCVRELTALVEEAIALSPRLHAEGSR